MLGLAKGLKENMTAPTNIMHALSSELVSAPAVSGGSQVNNVTNNNFSLTMPTTANPSSVQRAYNVMTVMAS
jgi:hypothetical protein